MRTQLSPECTRQEDRGRVRPPQGRGEKSGGSCPPSVPWLSRHHTAAPSRPLRGGLLGPNFLEEKVEAPRGQGVAQLVAGVPLPIGSWVLDHQFHWFGLYTVYFLFPCEWFHIKTQTASFSGRKLVAPAVLGWLSCRVPHGCAPDQGGPTVAGCCGCCTVQLSRLLLRVWDL